MKPKLRLSSRFIRLLGLVGALMAWPREVAVAAGFDTGWMAFGDMRGSIEPCGCDPATDYGGLKRLLTYIQREAAFRPEIQVLSLGNNLDPSAPNEVKNRAIIGGLSLAKPRAYLLNSTELLRWDSLRVWGAKDPKALLRLNFVLSNLRTPWSQGWVRPYILTDHHLIFGLTFDPRIRDMVDPWNRDLRRRIQDWKAAIKAQRTVILLFSGPDAELEDVLKSGLFDQVISSNNSPLEELPGSRERLDSNRLFRSPQRSVVMVPLGGQGVLRGGGLEGQTSVSMAGFLGQKPQGSPNHWSLQKPKPPFVGTTERFYWLGPDTGENEASLRLYADYMRQVEANAQTVNAARAKDLAASPFIGAEACKSCHPVEYAVYLKTKHAHAMDVLVQKSKAKDPECSVCHSVGVKAKGGFVSLELSPALAHVQCENCHGPRRDHAAMPKPLEKKVAGDHVKTCLQCHDTQHSPRFDFDQYWAKIRHGRGHEDLPH